MPCSRLLAVSVVIALPALAAAQAPAPPTPAPPSPPSASENVRVTLVQVPVTVVDGDGRFVPDLKAADFEVREDGRKIALDSVDVILYPRRRPEDAGAAAAEPDPEVSTAAGVRKFLLLFDRTFATQAEIQRALPAAARFVREQMGDYDSAAIAVMSAGGGLTVAQKFTPDRARLAEILERDTPSDAWDKTTAPSENASEKTPQDVRTSLAQDHARYRTQLASRQISQLGKLAAALETVPGRKYVVLFSHGFEPELLSGSTQMPAGPRNLQTDPWGDTDTFGDTGLRAELDEMVKACRKHDAVIYAIDVGGVAADIAQSLDKRVGPFGRTRESLAAIARGTGGKLLMDSNEYTPLLEQLMQETRGIYLLNFAPTSPGTPGRFHPLKVKVARRKIDVFVRTGYFEPMPR
jgi:VWFA-related protein